MLCSGITLLRLEFSIECRILGLHYLHSSISCVVICTPFNGLASKFRRL